jgi:DNA-binding MltR family transcriptional regulator
MGEDVRSLQASLLKKAHEVLLSVAIADSNRIEIDCEDIVPFYQGLLGESERSLGILAFTFIESQIHDLFSQRLNSKVNGGIESILGPNGILDTVGSQIKMLYALSWLTDKTQQDLRLLAKIRNRFAHAHSALTFEDRQIQSYMSSLTKHEERFRSDYPGVALKAQHTYLVRTVVTLFSFFAEITLMPSSLHAGMCPTGAFTAGFDRYPEQLQSALTCCVAAAFAIHQHASAG